MVDIWTSSKGVVWYFILPLRQVFPGHANTLIVPPPPPVLEKMQKHLLKNYDDFFGFNLIDKSI